MKKIVCLLFCLALALSVMAACAEEEHVHTFDSAWQYDADNHWHEATCEHSDQVSDKAPHIDEDEDNICDVCMHRAQHTHTFESTWTQGKTTHYYKATCGCPDDPEFRKSEAAHTDADNDGLCDVCEYDYGHEHTYAEGWTATEGGHWHLPTCGHDVDGKGLTAHADANNDGLCDDCGDNGGHEHTFAPEWSYDDNEHWHAPSCGHDIAPADKGAHVDGDGDQVCDTCQQSVGHFHTFAPEWSADDKEHWHQATCEHAEQRNDVAAHDGFEEDGVCDTCNHVVFELYEVKVQIPSQAVITDAEGSPLMVPFIVKEGQSLEFYIAVPNNSRLERVDNATVDLDNPVGPLQLGEETVYLFKVTVTPTEDTTVETVINKLVAAKVIQEGPGTMTSTKMERVYFNVTFTAPEDGKYTFACDNEYIDVGLKGQVKSMTKSFQFEAKAGEVVELQATYFPWGAETLEFNYRIVYVDDDFVLPYLKGEGYTLPTNMYVTVNFTLPEPGLYLFSSPNTLTFDVPGESEGTVDPQFFLATEPNQKFSVRLKFMTDAGTTFDFSWEIIHLKANTDLSEGTASVDVAPKSYTVYAFTAPKDGLYDFAKGSDQMNLLSYYDLFGNGHQGMYSYVGEHNLKKGETVLLMTIVNPYVQEPATSAYKDTITITYNGYQPEYTAKGDPIMIPGVWTTFTGTGDYEFTMPEGTQISFDEGVTWQSGTVRKNINGSIRYRVKNNNGSDAEIIVGLKKVEYKFAIDADAADNTFHMVPGKEYTVSLTSAAQSQIKDFLLSWTDANIVVTHGGVTLTSPADLTGFQTWGYVYITYNGTAEAPITFTLVDKTDYSAQGGGNEGGNEGGGNEGGGNEGGGNEGGEAPDLGKALVLGENAVEIASSGNQIVTFTASVSGTYSLSYAAGETNGDLYLFIDEYNNEWIESMPYEFTLAAGQSISFMVGTADWSADTIDLVLTKN